MKQTILFSLDKEELTAIVQNAVKEELRQFKQPENDSSNKLYTRKETAKILSVSLPTLSQWTKDGQIRSKRIGSNAIRYTHSDIQDALKERNFKLQ